MLIHRPSDTRGHANYGWLDTWHTFSFNTFHDPEWMEFSALRVINEDFIGPGEGFPTHPHREMEIITYVISGALAHRDSMGSETVMKPGVVQAMSAGSGLTHSEYNASRSEKTHMLQIWIRPEKLRVEPTYAERDFGEPRVGQGLRLLVSPGGADGSLPINQDARMYDAHLGDGESAQLKLAGGRSSWVQLIQGRLGIASLNGSGAAQDVPDGDGVLTLKSGDGLGIRELSGVQLTARGGARLIAFDLP